MPPCDSKHFQLDGLENFDYTTYVRNSIWGGRLYLLKESIDTIPRARRNYVR